MSIDDDRYSSFINPSDPSRSVDVGRTMRIKDSEIAADQRPATRAFLNVIRSRADLGVHAFIDGPVFLGAIRRARFHFTILVSPANMR